MALDIKPTRSELIKLKGRIKQTKNGYKLLKMKRDGLFHEFRTLLAEMIEAKRDLTLCAKLDPKNKEAREALASLEVARSAEKAAFREAFKKEISHEEEDQTVKEAAKVNRSSNRALDRSQWPVSPSHQI